MDEGRLAHALTGLVGNTLAMELAHDFVKLRRDYATKTLERTSPGKFVETFVQCLQQISRGSYDARPSVDDYLNTRVEHDTALPDGLRLCGGRVARAMYTLRNKRNIAHKGDVDPNTFDLALLHQAAAWIMAEMVAFQGHRPLLVLRREGEGADRGFDLGQGVERLTLGMQRNMGHRCC